MITAISGNWAIIASMACRPGALNLGEDKQKAKDELWMLVLIAAVGLLVIWWLPTLAGLLRLPQNLVRLGPTPLIVMVLTAVLLANVNFPPRQLVAAALMAFALVTLPSAVRQADSQITQRSFFGVYRVADSPETGYRTLVHGTTLHGAQRVVDE